MGFFPLHIRYPLVLTFVSQLVRFVVGAIVAVGVMVALNRARGWSPEEVREAVPLFALVVFSLAVVLATVVTWRKERRKRYYRRSRYTS